MFVCKRFDYLKLCSFSLNLVRLFFTVFYLSESQKIFCILPWASSFITYKTTFTNIRLSSKHPKLSKDVYHSNLKVVKVNTFL